MKLKDLDLVAFSKLVSQQVNQVTCLECCKTFTNPETTKCHHTLCHNCWGGRRTCPLCAAPCDKRDLRVNTPVHNLTEHVQTLRNSFEKLFALKLEEFLLDTVDDPSDPSNNVKEWLASSQNHFSAPAQSSEQSSDELQKSNTLEVSSSKIQIHNNSKKTATPEKVVHVSIPQHDWDKIETMAETEVVIKDKENIIGPMDIEPFLYDDNEYTTNNPRRSSRKRDREKTFDSIVNNENNSNDKLNFKDSSGETDVKSNKTKQTWNNVKRMRKEFSKLNKKNRNKLNVSIEMCKKTQSVAKATENKVNSEVVYEIDDNTPSVLPPTTDNENINNEKEKSESNKVIIVDDKIEAAKTTRTIIQKPSNSINNLSNTNDNQKNKTINQLSPKSVKNCDLVQNNNNNNTNANEQPKMPFYKKGLLHKEVETSPLKIVNHNIERNAHSNDDIEITIRVGNTITNVYIKKKNEIELKVNTDREVQTSFVTPNNKEGLTKQDSQNIHINIGGDGDSYVRTEPSNTYTENIKKQLSKNTASKKHTDSEDTATGQFEITESVEKELSKIMECAEEVCVIGAKTVTDLHKSISNNKHIVNDVLEASPHRPNVDELDDLNDIDIFESGSLKELHVEKLKRGKQCPSEILMPTVSSKFRTQKLAKKRDRDENDQESQCKKKKLNLESQKTQIIKATSILLKNNENLNESEPMNYDAVMDKVFANIDADIEEIKNTQSDKSATKHIASQKEKVDTQTENLCSTVIDISTQNFNELCNQKDSENVFSVCLEKEKPDEVIETVNDKVPEAPHPNTQNFLTPVNHHKESSGVIIEDDNDDSDKSVVEETPQKTTSFSKLKPKSNGGNKSETLSKTVSNAKALENDNIKTIVNLTDSSTMDTRSKDITVIDNIPKKSALETPLTINKFVNHITYKSTPFARKSLNFESENDPEQTLCPSNVEVAKTTQEKEFLAKAFEKTPKSVTSNEGRTKGLIAKKYCIAGSCLSASEIARVKLLCSRHKWTYLDKYCKELTHLIVGVDDENKSQRSVKYMCALAASKWIVSYEWVEKCLQTYTIVNEQNYEALDSTGEAGPLRSRTSHKKLFKGIKFYCMEPFSVLDVDTLKDMLRSSGGLVVSEARDVKITDKCDAPAILLAEPENTQEDKFIYLAMELNIVPVNYEWVLNCLGSYTLSSIIDLLLCPSTILPKAIQRWPPLLLAREDD